MRIKTILGLLFIFLQFQTYSMGQSIRDVADFKSHDYETRYQAAFYFSQFSKANLNETIFNAAGDALKYEIEHNSGPLKIKKKKENKKENTGEAAAEAYVMYIVNLCQIVGQSNDNKYLSLLIASCPTADNLLKFGDDAANLLLDELKTATNSHRKSVLISVLGVMLQPKATGYVLRGDNRIRLKKLLIQQLSDNDIYLKKAAVRALGDSQDDDIKYILEDLAKNDGEHFIKHDRVTGNAIDRYPVREETEKALLKFNKSVK